MKLDNRLKKLIGIFCALIVFTLLIVSGPVSALNIVMTATANDGDGDGYYEPGETVLITANISIANGEHVPIKNLTLTIQGSTNINNCLIPINSAGYLNNQVNCTDSSNNTVSLVVNMTRSTSFGFGYAYGYVAYLANATDSFDHGYDGYYWSSAYDNTLFGDDGNGYGYSGYEWNETAEAYSYSVGDVSMKFTILMTVPSTWSTGTYKSVFKVTMPDSSDADSLSDTLISTASFTLTQSSTTTTTASTTTTLSGVGGSSVIDGGSGGDETSPTTTLKIVDIPLIEKLLKSINPADLGMELLSSADVDVEKTATLTSSSTVTTSMLDSIIASATDDTVLQTLRELKSALESNELTSITATKKLEVYDITSKTTGKKVSVSVVTISFTADRNMKDVQIIEVIPKTVAGNANLITFIGEQPTVLQADPVVQWTFDSVSAGQTKDMSYQVKGKLTSIESQSLITGKVTAAEAGTTTTTIKGTEPIEEVNYTWLWVILIIVVIVIALLYFKPWEPKPKKIEERVEKAKQEAVKKAARKKKRK
ncbi:MAG: hypothetical protein J4473_00890 [Candidatus Aenigmarchaeota archaeon]|nr:hypothetical protein [Candidatus Aenigmarchaeota archaeon]